jgi:hypothetical protein
LIDHTLVDQQRRSSPADKEENDHVAVDIFDVVVVVDHVVNDFIVVDFVVVELLVVRLLVVLLLGGG